MSISILNHDRVRALGIDINGGAHIPPECFEVSYVGAVLDDYERNGYQDSDFYAVVWDEAEQTVKSVEYASTRGWTYANGCTVDATPEVQAKAQDWWRQHAIAAEEAHERARYARPYVGATVTVARGRKVPQGFTGVVLSLEELPRPIGRQRYSPNRNETWAFVSNETGAYKVRADHCDVRPDPERVEQQIAAHMEQYRRRINASETNGRSMLWVGYRSAA